jgi:F-type H+-transporting ATPase subunit epsilon
MSLEVSIIVPDRVFWKDNAKEIILPTLSGQMGVLKDHIPLLTGLDTGLLLIRLDSKSDWIKLVVMGGFALVNNNKIIILVNEAEFGSNINVEEAEATFIASKLALENVFDEKKKIELNAQFKRARARFQVVKI